MDGRVEWTRVKWMRVEWVRGAARSARSMKCIGVRALSAVQRTLGRSVKAAMSVNEVSAVVGSEVQSDVLHVQAMRNYRNGCGVE